MSDVIRTVEVEFLRSGPPHNQLLSPLTEYLAVSGDSGAGTVRVPFEQASFNRRLANLRYGDNDEQDAGPRLETLRTTGTALGEVLDTVPGLVGALSERAGPETLVNLRIVTSASELAMLPFEMAREPSGSGRVSANWLALKSGTPICITRRVRSVSTDHELPAAEPKVLFIVGLEIDQKLEDAHKQALNRALAPWRTQQHEPLVHLPADSADVQTIRDRLIDGVTSVHILAHGAPSQLTEGDQYGILLNGIEPVDGDVVTGDRFASVLRSLPTGTRLPSAIVVASCDSAHQADLLVPGGSFAQSLHLAGVPLVIASQFPLTEEASVRLTELLYDRMLWGRNPLPAVAVARAALHAEFADTHDWASLVVFDALPDDLEVQLSKIQYRRAVSAVNAALSQLDKGLADMEQTRAFAEGALERLPESPAYEMEVNGLKASFAKRMAAYYYEAQDFGRSQNQLKHAHRIYDDSASRFLQTGLGEQNKASLHWLQTQAISLARILGLEPHWGAWMTAMRSAELDNEREQPDNRAWAHASLSELWLLSILDDDTDEEGLVAAKDSAIEHARNILAFYPMASDFHVLSTKRQFDRYVQWWATDDFADAVGLERSERWTHVRELAAELVAILSEATDDEAGAEDEETDDEAAATDEE